MKNSIKKISLAAGMLLIAGQLTAQAPGWFKKVNDEVGWDLPKGGAMVSIADVNNDDYPDIVTVETPPGTTIYTVLNPVRIYLNIQDPEDAGKRKFIDITAQSGVNVVPPDTGNNANCYTLADFNNDGNIDIVTGNYYHRLEHYSLKDTRCQVYLGDGAGNFTWLDGNGLDKLPLINVRAISALDYDRDGNLDLFIAAWFKDYQNNVWDHGYLLKGKGDGTFSDVTDVSGIGDHKEPMYGSAATDWNNDCYPDIFTAPYCRTPGIAFQNDGNGGFTNIATTIDYNLYHRGSGQQACTFAVIPEDVNNDGNMDLFFSVVHGGNGAGEFRSTIGINKGPDHNYAFDIRPDFLPVSPPASFHRGDYDGSFLDFDNDGLKDLIMVQGTYVPATDRTYFWKQQSDHSFKEVAAELGLLVADLRNTAAIEPFDYDLDGDDDFIVLGAGIGFVDIWRNDVGNKNNWIAVKLILKSGGGSNMSAIGTRVYVYYNGKMQMREVMAGRGQHAGQQPFIMNFGLGNATHIDSIVVRWPDHNCSRKTITNVGVNQKVVVNNFPVDIPEPGAHAPELKVFPNPTTRYVVVQREDLTDHVREARLLDVTGKMMHIRYSTSDGDKLIFDLGSVPEGIYLIHITDKRAQTTIHRVIKK